MNIKTANIHEFKEYIQVVAPAVHKVILVDLNSIRTLMFRDLGSHKEVKIKKEVWNI